MGLNFQFEITFFINYLKIICTFIGYNFSVGHENGIETAKKNAEKLCADMCCDKAKFDSQINALYV